MSYGPNDGLTKWIYDSDGLADGTPILATHWLTFGYFPVIPLRRAVVIPEVVILKPADPVYGDQEQKIALGYIALENRRFNLKEILFTYFCRWVLGVFAFLFDLIVVALVFVGGIVLLALYPSEVGFDSDSRLFFASWFVVGLLVFALWVYFIFNQKKLLHIGFRWIERYESRGLRGFAKQDGQAW